MKATRTTVARLLPLLALLALLPFATWSCEDAGDEPAGPTGPGSQYNPAMDTPGARIKVQTQGEVGPGGEFDLIAAFTDGDGRPVQGIPLTAQAETGTGKVVDYFTFDTNPTITNAQGRASIHVNVSADCPEGSYHFVVSSSPGGDGPVNGPYARGFAGVTVSGVGTAAVSVVTLITTTPTVELVSGLGNAVFSIEATKTDTCTLVITYDAVGVGYAVSGSTYHTGLLSLPVSSTGTLTVQVTGYCSEDPTETVLSAPVSVTVQDLTSG
jgi:hypothetical protein